MPDTMPDLTKLCKTKADWQEAAEQLQRRNHRLQELNHQLAIQLAQAKLNGGTR
ncbi:hypothetical protein GCM10011374_03210 [Kocuria dechangensis]|uniref:Uncharacterized protein n=1 Tax=Kocuria dechangensis TaxID=1176249 RepID=A0A917GG80_9MICC|nr:hypothetical protein [Kocuria dechangensis]GGG44252.1 hypothetical protein GCM10011374_03210 [Kocuria dechangensis]